MKKLIFTVTTKNGKTLDWIFHECNIKEDDYGNKKYIAYTTPSNETALIDCRYAQKYDFRKVCVDFLIEWYGNNLDELSEKEINLYAYPCESSTDCIEFLESAKNDISFSEFCKNQCSKCPHCVFLDLPYIENVN